VGSVVITLGATNYQGFGEWIGGKMQSSVLQPGRNFIVEKWLVIGTNGWYILATVLAVSIAGALFWVPLAYGVFWKKGIQGRFLHKATPSTPLASMQRTLSTEIPIGTTQPTPSPTMQIIEEKKEEA
jgi:hypothetical protein